MMVTKKFGGILGGIESCLEEFGTRPVKHFSVGCGNVKTFCVDRFVIIERTF